MNKEERNNIIDSVIEKIESEMFSWFENDSEYHFRCKELHNIANKIKQNYKNENNDLE